MKRYDVYPRVLLAAALLVICSCSPRWSAADRMEGFRSGTLRVYLRLNLAEEERGKKIGETGALYREEGARRAELLLRDQVRTALGDTLAAGEFMKDIPKMLEAPHVAHENCEEEFCEAFVDFDVKEWMGRLEAERKKLSEKKPR